MTLRVLATLLMASVAFAGPVKKATPAKATAAAVIPAAFLPGVYECWNNNRARMDLNFTADASMKYVDAEGAHGSVTYDAATGHLIFKGGALDGTVPAGGWIMYHEPKGHPTVSFRNKEGYEISFCEKT